MICRVGIRSPSSSFDRTCFGVTIHIRFFLSGSFRKKSQTFSCSTAHRWHIDHGDGDDVLFTCPVQGNLLLSVRARPVSQVPSEKKV